MQATSSGNDLILFVNVKAGSLKEEISLQNDAIVIRIKAQREKGRANEAVREFLSKLLDLPKSAIEVLSGHTSPKKKIKISGCSADQFRKTL